VDRHLNDAELNQALAGNLSPEIEEHLEACAICRSSRNDMEYLFRSLSAEAETLAEKPDAFWLAQRRQIQNRAPQPRTMFAPQFAWAGLAATIILAVTLLLRSGPAVKPDPPQRISENDQQLMVDVEQTLDSKLAPPLEPTGALVDAMTQTTTSSYSHSGSKENRNEN
jgi:predicted anti-sigma-YlaC factor YlaD